MINIYMIDKNININVYIMLPISTKIKYYRNIDIIRMHHF